MMILNFFLALSPILWLIIALMGLKIPGYKACVSAFFLTMFLAASVWKMSVIRIASAGAEGMVMAIWPISVVIIAAIFTYNLCIRTGAMDKIKQMLTSVSEDKRILILIVAWGFGGFMEGMAGFGTAVAIPASMLCGLGFDPIFSAVVCLVANATPTAFGSIGIPTITVSNITGLDPMRVAFMTTIQLAPLVILTPFLLVMMTGKSIRALKGVWHITLASGLAFIIPQMLAARFMGAELPDILGSVCAMFVTILLAKRSSYIISEEYRMEQKKSDFEKIDHKEAIRAWSPFILIFIFLILTSKAVPLFHNLLGQVKTAITIYQGDGASVTTFQWLLTPGVLIILAALIGGKLQGASIGEVKMVFINSLKQMWKTVLTIASIMGAAKIMGYSGMISEIASVLVLLTGNFYPVIAPFIGSIGTFVTGSATSASVLFGALQLQTAKELKVNEIWLVASNTVGADAGKIISPQSVAIAIAAINQPGTESKIIRQSSKYYVLFVMIMGLVGYIGTRVY